MFAPNAHLELILARNINFVLLKILIAKNLMKLTKLFLDAFEDMPFPPWENVLGSDDITFLHIFIFIFILFYILFYINLHQFTYINKT